MAIGGNVNKDKGERVLVNNEVSVSTAIAGVDFDRFLR